LIKNKFLKLKKFSYNLGYLEGCVDLKKIVFNPNENITDQFVQNTNTSTTKYLKINNETTPIVSCLSNTPQVYMIKILISTCWIQNGNLILCVISNIQYQAKNGIYNFKRKCKSFVFRNTDRDNNCCQFCLLVRKREPQNSLSNTYLCVYSVKCSDWSFYFICVFV